MTPIELLALCLAAGAVVDVWQQGSIFEGARAAVRETARLDYSDRAMRAWKPIRSRIVDLRTFAARMLDCWYCFSHWVPAMLLVACVAPGIACPGLRPWAWLPVYSLAATRVVLLVNGLLPPRLRHDPVNDDES